MKMNVAGGINFGNIAEAYAGRGSRLGIGLYKYAVGICRNKIVGVFKIRSPT